MTTDVDIKNLFTLADMQRLLDVFQRVWSFPPGGLVSPDFLVALTHAGGYTAAAVDADGTWIGGSFGFLGRHGDRLCLHSHVTGVVPGREHAGVGRQLKFHQRAWARQHGIPYITWTFDPLVRRNAWFNLQVLGVAIDEYVVNFYGPLNDEINGDDDTDRLVAVWTVEGTVEHRTPRPSTEVPTSHRIVPTPPDIVALRRADPAAARQWRRDLREALDAPLALGWTIHELTTDGCYVLRPPEHTAPLSHDR